MISNIVTRILYQGDGETVEFPFPFKILLKSDIKVVISDGEVEQLLTSDYFVDMDKGTVKYPGYAPGEEPAERLQPMKLQKGWSIAIYRDTLITQDSTYGKKWPFDEIEDSMDKATMIEQELKDKLARTVRLADTATTDVSVKLPYPQKGYAIGWSHDEKSLINIPVSGGHEGGGYDSSGFEKKWTYYNRRLKEIEKELTDRESRINAQIKDIDHTIEEREKNHSKELSDAYAAISTVESRVTHMDSEIESRIKAGAEKYFQVEIKKETSPIFSQITQLNDVLNSKVADLESKTGTQITQLKDSISATVKNELAGVESHITQLDNSIDTRISNKTAGIESRITQLSGSIDMNVINKLREVASKVTQLDDTILLKVSNKLSGLESQIVQLDNSIDSKISDKTKQMDTRITQLSSSITSQVNSRLSGMESRVDQFDDLIKTRVTNRLSGMESQMAQMDDLIDAKVKDKAEGLTSEIAVMKGVITEQVEDKLKKVRSEITQVGDGIRISVEGKADKKNLITQINASPEKLRLDSRLIEINGDTKFNNNVIIGGALKANSITYDKLNINSLSAITANLGTVTAGKIKGLRYESRTGNAWIEDDEIHGMKISADAFYEAGYRVRNLSVEEIIAPPFTKLKPPVGASLQDLIPMHIVRLDYVGTISIKWRKHGGGHIEEKGFDDFFANIKVTDDNQKAIIKASIKSYLLPPGTGNDSVCFVDGNGIVVCADRSGLAKEVTSLHENTEYYQVMKLYFAKINAVVIRR